MLWVLLLGLLLPAESAASGGGHIQLTRPMVQVTFETPRKTPTPQGRAAWAKRVAEWEATNKPVAEKVAAAIEGVLPRYKAKLEIVANGFAGDGGSYRQLSSEGVAEAGGDEGARWRLDVDLDLFAGTSNTSRARFVFETRPSKTDVRAFSRDVQAAALKVVGHRLPPLPTYTAYWLSDDGRDATLLLTSVPLAKLTETLDAQQWREPSFETFRTAPALVLTTKDRKYITRNGAGFLLANLTGATVDPGEGALSYQANGSTSPKLRVTKAARADVLKLLDAVIDPSLEPADAATERKQVENDAEFLQTLKPLLAK